MTTTEAANKIAQILTAISPLVPTPFDVLARIAAAGITAAGAAMDAGVSEHDVIKSIHRIRHIDP